MKPLLATLVAITLLTFAAAAQTLTPIYSFTNYPASPECDLVQGPDGSFYGTTSQGGSGAVGAVFRLATNGTLTTLVNFANDNGAYPAGGLILGGDGNFYGTTSQG